VPKHATNLQKNACTCNIIKCFNICVRLLLLTVDKRGPGSSVGVDTDYGLEGPVFEAAKPEKIINYYYYDYYY
jgi:hypothetical protein